MAPTRHDWKIVDWDVKPQHNQPFSQNSGNIDMWSQNLQTSKSPDYCFGIDRPGQTM